ncbi:MAG: hypothetical protein MK212_04350 [Saprospiraceae bacterium]|nr:hypothetical protein [Saprospiraceae bacterium]
MRNITIVILAITILLMYSCGEQQQAQTEITEVAKTPEGEAKAVTVRNDEGTSSPQFKFSKKVNLPNEIENVDAFDISSTFFVVRDDDMVYFLDRMDYTKILKKFQLKNSTGKRLGGYPVSILGQIKYLEKLDAVLFMDIEENEIYHYDKNGQYVSTLKKPSTFKPRDMAVDHLEERGIYVYSMAKFSGEVYFWESLDAEPQLVLEGTLGMNITSLVDGSTGFSKGFTILDSSGDGIHSFLEKDGKWLLVSSLTKVNRINTHGGDLLRTNQASYFVFGSFLDNKERKYETIRTFGIHAPQNEPSKNLFKYEIIEYPPNIEEDLDKHITDLGFSYTDMMYVLINQKLYLYKEQ